MTRKEALKQIAQRCMDGEDVMYLPCELYCAIEGKENTRDSYGTIFIDGKPKGFYIPSKFRGVQQSLDAVSALEVELLSDWWMIDVAVSAKMAVSRTFKVIGNECKCMS